MKIEEMTLIEIEEYLKNITDEETNLYIRCLNCDEYTPICNINIITETCNNCDK